MGLFLKFSNYPHNTDHHYHRHHHHHQQHHQVQHFAFIVFANQINFQEFVVTKQAALKLSLF